MSIITLLMEKCNMSEQEANEKIDAIAREVIDEYLEKLPSIKDIKAGVTAEYAPARTSKRICG